MPHPDTIRLLSTETPWALHHLSAAELAPLRAAAILDANTGDSRHALKQLKGFQTRCHLTAEGALFTLIFHVNAILRHREAQASLDIQPFAKVSGFGDAESCAYCRGRNGKVYHAHEIDLPPFPRCTCPRGCKCMVIYLSPEDAKEALRK